MKCLQCRSQIGDGDKFCEHCGHALHVAPIRRFCTGCGNKLDISAIFCPQCGTKADAAILRLSLVRKNSGLASYAELYELSDSVPLHDHVIAALQNLQWKITHYDGNIIRASIEMTFLSWGEKFEVNLGLPRQLSISSRCKAQLYDWNKNKENIRYFMGAFYIELWQHGLFEYDNIQQITSNK